MFLFGVLLASAHATQMVSASVFLLLDRSILGGYGHHVLRAGTFTPQYVIVAWHLCLACPYDQEDNGQHCSMPLVVRFFSGAALRRRPHLRREGSSKTAQPEGL